MLGLRKRKSKPKGKIVKEWIIVCEREVTGWEIRERGDATIRQRKSKLKGERKRRKSGSLYAKDKT